MIIEINKDNLAEILADSESILVDIREIDEFMDFMKNSESDSMKVLLAEFADELSDEEIRMLRIKFISDVAN